MVFIPKQHGIDMRKPKVVVTNPAFPETLELLASHCEVVSNPGPGPLARPELLALCLDAQAIVAFMPDRIDDDFLRECPSLRIVGCALKGFDNFDVAACTRRKIWITAVPDLLTEPTAELALGLMISLGRHILGADAHLRSGGFQGWRPTFYGRSIDGSAVGILGGGAVGAAIARKLSGFQCRTLVYDPDPVRQLPSTARWATAGEVLSQSDFLVSALPLVPGTLHYLDEQRLAHVKRGCLLVNPSRGSVVHEEAVVRALKSGQLGGYAADVFEFEDWARSDRPLEVHPELIAMADKTVLTTHIGSAVTEVRRKIERDAALNVLEALRGERPHGAINQVG
ncbi:phosphonate dehydrogenase [Ramlibacter tataouinensis]|uniref:Candidate phosphonate dehydrogenase (NAD-dependent phosphite dehydrogenase) n=1 Tax=Ramlibacter tataouinensis (strain ATCC BAA-407 / DSM 14655 / LMG 21543 / TTB310) TaxID=365046 RepID=F5XW31_RAMTT|nr:phosphonate dehydrogenase [Ramlibacter tataouinensis]AEG94134.1 Candidate phosphonate dehydrogenase (NAD-dependent phosphite dehydrogenase) [Ramlibacter tataouinensis TTB310]